MISFNKIVSKLSKFEGTLLNLYDIGNIIDPDFTLLQRNKITEIYKLIYRLKANNIIVPIKNSLYYVSNSASIDFIEILDKHYWRIIKKIIIDETGGKYVILGKKSLEIHLKDYSIHNKLIVYTKDIQKIVTINGDLKIYFKRFTGGKHSNNISFNIFLNKYSELSNFEGVNLTVGNKELSLLDSLLISSTKDGIDTYLIKKYLAKYSKILSREILGGLVKIKYISSINRLRSLSKDLNYENLYATCLDVIKVEGANCFLTLK